MFLFFNADLVQRKIDKHGGSIAFIDDYTAWVTGPTAEANTVGIQSIIDHALNWERRSGATFESEKTSLIHFTRNKERSSNTPILVKEKLVMPKETAKILGVLMDSGLRYKQHIARTATRGLKAALALKRLRMTSPSTARQLFTATVAPVVDYASNVWMHACQGQAMAALNRVQRIGGQAIIGAFRTVATTVAEAEASIRTISERHADRATSFWMNSRTLPRSHPIPTLKTRVLQRFTSPLQKIALTHQSIVTEGMETIYEYAIAPWEERIQKVIDTDLERATSIAKNIGGIRIATSSSCRAELVGIGAVKHDNTINPDVATLGSQHNIISIALGPRSEQNVYTAELSAIATGLRELPTYIHRRQIIIFTSNQAAIKAISNPNQQSGQHSIRQIYDATRELKKGNNHVLIMWVPAGQDFDLVQTAKQAAQQAIERGQLPQALAPKAKSTLINRAKATRTHGQRIPQEVGKYSRELDIALPGRHTRTLYDTLHRIEASVLAQLRTGMNRLNGYLNRIGVTESEMCVCGQAKETVKHFLFRCTRWDALRIDMLNQSEMRRNNLSFFLGGKSLSDPKTWTPNMDAVL